MASSFVSFRENGFWARDSWLQLWLGCLVTQVDRQADTPVWLQDWKRQAHTYASGCFAGCVSAGLDDFVTDESRRQQIVAVCELAGQRMDSIGVVASEIEVEWINNQSEISETHMEELLSLRAAFLRLLQRQRDSYFANTPSSWEYDQVAPLTWWRGSRTSTST